MQTIATASDYTAGCNRLQNGRSSMGALNMRIPATSGVVAFSVVGARAAACGGGQQTEATPPPSTPPTLHGAYGVYVTNEVSGDLSVIDPATNTAVATLP